MSSKKSVQIPSAKSPFGTYFIHKAETPKLTKTIDFDLKKPTFVVKSNSQKEREKKRNEKKGGRKYGTRKRRNKKSKRNTRKK